MRQSRPRQSESPSLNTHPFHNLPISETLLTAEADKIKSSSTTTKRRDSKCAVWIQYQRPLDIYLDSCVHSVASTRNPRLSRFDSGDHDHPTGFIVVTQPGNKESVIRRRLYGHGCGHDKGFPEKDGPCGGIHMPVDVFTMVKAFTGLSDC